MNFDVAVVIYLSLLCLVGTVLGLKRQLLQIISLVISAVAIYVTRYNLLDAAAAGLHIHGFTARASLLVPLFILWYIIYRVLLFLLKPFMREPARLSGALFGLIRGLVDVGIIGLFLVLAFPTLELRVPAPAGWLDDSLTFRSIQRFDDTSFNPLKKWSTYWILRDLFRAPVDAVARDRLQNDPNYRDLLSTESLFQLMEDDEYQEAVSEGRLQDALRNPNLKAFLNDEEAFLAAAVFLFGGGRVDDAVKYEGPSAPTRPARAAGPQAPPPPPPTMPPLMTKPPGKKVPAAPRRDMKLIILNNGCKMKGVIKAMDDEQVDTDILMGRDFLNVTFSQSEIREIRDIP